MVIFGWRVPTWLIVVATAPIGLFFLLSVIVGPTAGEDRELVESSVDGPAVVLNDQQPMAVYEVNVCPSGDDMWGRYLALQASAKSDGGSKVRAALKHDERMSPADSMDMAVDERPSRMALARDLRLNAIDGPECDSGFEVWFERLDGDPVRVEWRLNAKASAHHGDVQPRIDIREQGGAR